MMTQSSLLYLFDCVVLMQTNRSLHKEVSECYGYIFTGIERFGHLANICSIEYLVILYTSSTKFPS